ncbi:MAG: alpha/beta fold hydrolase [Bryobacterales bacterium]|nr:alpha/beta fold hydrolase [Bryobacterales bacterium]
MKHQYESATEPVEGYLSFRGFRTWYQVVGQKTGGVPLVLLHGGPGIPSGAFAGLMARLGSTRPVVRYDQIGCGRSDRPRDASLWKVSTFIEELSALREHLGLTEIHLLGHSWGGMLAIEYLLTRPAGIRSLTLSSSLCSTKFWVQEARLLRSAMPGHVVKSMQRFEEWYGAHAGAAAAGVAGTQPGIAPSDVAASARMMKRSLALVTSWPVQRLASLASYLPPLRRASYEIAGVAFMRRHLCRMADFPLALCEDFLARNQELYETMWGPSEFFATGVLADWDTTSRLGEIRVPTLLLSGRYDEATPAQQERLREGIPGSRWVVFEDSAHMAFLEEPDRYFETLSRFLDACENDAPMGLRSDWVLG